jgi:hypothetical protein
VQGAVDVELFGVQLQREYKVLKKNGISLEINWILKRKTGLGMVLFLHIFGIKCWRES